MRPFWYRVIVGLIIGLQAPVVFAAEPAHTFREGWSMVNIEPPAYGGDSVGVVVPNQIHTKYQSFAKVFLFDQATYEQGVGITNITAPYANKPTIVYLSTSTPTGGTKVTTRIYRYDLVSKHKILMFKVTEGNPVSYRIVGYDTNGKKLILEQLTDNSPGPCAGIWNGGDLFFSLSTVNFDAGLKPWTIPQYLVDQANQKTQACGNQMNNETTSTQP